MTTAKQIILMAYAKSKRNNPGTDASETGELLPLLHRALSALFAVGARVNPYFFAASSSVAYAGVGWPRPAAAEAVFGVETASGVEVVVVPREQKDAEPGLPSVYRWGQVYRPTGGVQGPTAADTLTFLYSKVPDAIATLDTELDPLWREGYNELLALELAIYMALKDGGERATSEVPPLREQRDAWVNRFVAHLEHETVGERRSYGHIRRFNTNTLVPIASLLAGGSNVQLAG